MKRPSLIAVSAVVLLGGCRPGPDTSLSDDPAPLPTHDRIALNDVGLDGYLQVHEGCFYLEWGARNLGLVFPAEYRRGDASGRPAIVDEAGRILAVESEYVGTGGDVERNRPSPCRLDVDIYGTLLASEIGPVEPED